MKSATAVTFEMYDMSLAAEELLLAITEKLCFQKNSCAVLFCDIAIDFKTLSAELRKRLPCDLIGITSLAAFDYDVGYNDTGAVLLVLSADDVYFSIAGSEPLTPANIKESVSKAYSVAVKGLEGEPSFIIAFPPVNKEIPQDEYVNILDELSGGIPILGGFPSSPEDGAEERVLIEGDSYADRLGLLLIGGNIQPVFAVRDLATSSESPMSLVTSSEGIRIYTVENETFFDFWTSQGFSLDNEDISNQALSNKNLLALLVLDSNSKYSNFLARTLFGIDRHDGSAVLCTRVPEGSMISVTLIKRRDLEISMEEALKDFNEKIENARCKGYEFSTVICISCPIRNVMMANRNPDRVSIIKDNIPEGLALMGFYAKGEFSPVFDESNPENFENCVHNISISFCAF